MTLKADVYNQLGKKVSSIDLPESVFALPENLPLIHQVFVSMMSNLRTNIAHTKGRGEVSGGGKKPWKQKGTGRARHGSTRSPIWIGGGVALGPTNQQNFKKKINTKMKTKALYTVLSQKLAHGEIIFVDSLGFDAPKTKDAKAFMDSLAQGSGIAELGNKRNNRAYIATVGKNDNVLKSFGNFGSVKVDEVRKLSTLDALTYKYIIITNPQASLENLASRAGSKDAA